MYGMLEQEISRQQRGQMRREVAAIRLEKIRMMGDTKWELERYAGLLKKRMRNLG